MARGSTSPTSCLAHRPVACTHHAPTGSLNSTHSRRLFCAPHSRVDRVQIGELRTFGPSRSSARVAASMNAML